MTLPTGDEQDPKVLLGRLIERTERTNEWFAEWMDYIHDRFERGATEMSLLRAEIAELRAHLAHRTPAAETEKPRGAFAPFIQLLKAGKEFLEAVASLKELALALAILAASTAAIKHPEAVRGLIDSYVAAGRAAHE
jgi:hypothetical protein